MTDKYKIAQEVFDEFIDTPAENVVKNFMDFLKEKNKPKDTLFERVVEFIQLIENEPRIGYVEDRVVNMTWDIYTAKMFVKFKEIFKEVWIYKH